MRPTLVGGDENRSALPGNQIPPDGEIFMGVIDSALTRIEIRFGLTWRDERKENRLLS